MAPPLVALDDFAAWLGVKIAGEDSDRANRYLVGASGLVRSTAGCTWLDTADPTQLGDVPEEIETVVLQVAERKWRNPAGVVHSVAGPFSDRWAEDVGQGLYLTESERLIVESFRPTSGLGVIETTRGDIETESIYVDVEGSDRPIPALGI